MHVRRFIFMVAASAVVVSIAAGALAQSDTDAQGATPPQPKPCSQAECRQFDFWVGEWDVYGPGGKLVGKNTIQPILDGCVLEENWKSEGGPFSGTSYNLYDAQGGKWHQTWVDNTGRLLQLDGGIVDGKMVLWGTRPANDAGAMEVIHRISWEKKADDEVRQLWETSPDGGISWNVAFDGKYVRRKP